MRNRFFCLVFLGAIFVVNGNAQVFIQNTLYAFNRTVYNPAAVGMAPEGKTNVTLLGRLQWLGIDGAPTLFTAAGDTKIDGVGGVGAYLIADKLGPLTTTGLNAAYSYHLPLVPDERLVLGIGASGGFLQKSINGDFRYDDSNGIDPLVPLGQFSNAIFVPNLAAGLYLSGRDEDGIEQFYFGVSGQDLLEPSIDALTQSPGVGPDSRVSRTFYLTGGYRFNLSEDIELEPSFLVRTDGVSSQFDLSAFLTLKSLVLFGLSHRFYNDSFAGSLGVRISDNSLIAYSYDYTLNGLNQNGDISSHEIILSYTFPQIGKKRKVIDGTKEGRNSDF